MCAIAGIISQQAVLIENLQAMTRVARHRGPDDEAYLVIGQSKGPADGQIERLKNSIACHTALGHCRLAIVDPSKRGRQPMVYQGRYAITFNGEIYNHEELREQLGEAGFKFKSGSDAETIMAAYAHWGQACVERFRGMWAFALVDTEKSSVFFSRDRFGIKPLYYTVFAERFCFASEIKQLLTDPDLSPELNRERAYDFILRALHDHTDESLFKGVKQLQAGHNLVLDLKNLQHNIYCYYEPGAQKSDSPPGPLLERASRLRLQRAPALGLALSGGIDSSALAVMAFQYGKKPPAFSMILPGRAENEAYYSSAVSRQLGLKHFTVAPDDTLFAELNQCIKMQDEPFFSASILAQRALYQFAAKNGRKTLLDGQGADEIFAGYHSFWGALLLGYFFKLQFIKFLQAFKALGQLGKSRLRLMFTALLTAARAREYRSRQVLPGLHRFLGPPRLKLPFFLNSIRKQALYELKFANQARLHYADRNAMGVAIESRFVFFDVDVVESCLGLKADDLMLGPRNKIPLRNLNAQLLPAEISERIDKVGFAFNESQWILENLDTIVGEIKLFFSERMGLTLNENRLQRDQGLLFRLYCFVRWVMLYKVQL